MLQPFAQTVTINVTVRFDDYSASQVEGSGTIIRQVGSTGGGILIYIYIEYL